MPSTHIHVEPDKARLADEVAERFVVHCRQLLAVQEEVHTALTGGSMGAAVLVRVHAHPGADDLDWSRMHFWWGDERWVEAQSADRNDEQSRQALLAHRPIPQDNIHAFLTTDAGVSLDAAAEIADAQLRELRSRRGGRPLLDITFLGVGPDGHVASLFPGHPEIDVTGACALPVRDSPKPPPERLTMTREVLCASGRIWMVVAGPDKVDAVRAIRGGDQHLPAARVSGLAETVLFLDAAAAGPIPGYGM